MLSPVHLFNGQRRNYIVSTEIIIIFYKRSTESKLSSFGSLQAQLRSRNCLSRYEANSEYAMVTLRIDIDQRNYS